MMLLPMPFLLAIVFLFGIVFGSFANVVVYRLHTGRSLNNRSRCLSCGRGLTWYELVPVLSYVVLRGRCRTCGSYIPIRYALVEGAMGLGFVLAFLAAYDLVFAMLLAAFMFVLIVGAVYDLYHFIIPDEVVLGLGVLAVAAVGYESYQVSTFAPLIDACIAAVSAFAFFGGLWLVSKGRWIGFGDAKLAAPLAFLVGTWASFSLVVLSFWVGAAVSVCVMGIQAIRHGGQSPLRNGGRRITMKSEIPFAPFLMLAFILVYVFHIDVLALTEYVLVSNI